MTVTYENFVSWEQEKAVYLQKIAIELGMDLDGSGEIAVNRSSGNTYLWLEDYSFVLYLSIACELKKHDVWVMYQDINTGEEHEDTLDCIGDTYQDIENWISKNIEEVA